MADNPVITDEMVSLWNTLKEITAAGADRQWESDGGRLAEYYAANTRLDNELLGMMPHETPPIRAHVYGRPPASLHDDDAAWKRVDAPQIWQRESYRRAYRLSVLLDKAGAASRRVARSRVKPTPARERESV